jgi:hypothetical protein
MPATNACAAPAARWDAVPGARKTSDLYRCHGCEEAGGVGYTCVRCRKVHVPETLALCPRCNVEAAG